MGLSVDEVSSDPSQCWNLAPPGLLGPQATVYYLDRLVGCRQGWLRLDLPEEHPELRKIVKDELAEALFARVMGWDQQTGYGRAGRTPEHGALQI